MSGMHLESKEKIRVNGKQQMIDLLKFMEGEEKTNLIRNIVKRNPTLARELMEASFNFKSLNNMSDDKIVLVLGYVNNAVIGLALKNSPASFQRRVLSLLERSRAEEAFGILQRTGHAISSVLKAQEKIVSVAVALSKKKQISLY
ncbi:MAG: hypothetical protein JNM93_10690 [Bacteriovoracaceae bacterium]|nr:hypothetical protein [Bacteriovoracaceae bacterium]